MAVPSSDLTSRRAPCTRRAPWRALVVLDLEATLLAEPGALSRALSTALGTKPQLAKTVQDVAAQRLRMAARLRRVSWDVLRESVLAVPLVPHAAESIGLLQLHGIACALVTDGWEFAADWIGAHLGIQHVLGTGLEPSGKVVHVWPEDRLEFMQRTAFQLHVPIECTEFLAVRQRDLLQVAYQFIERADSCHVRGS